MSKWYQNGVEGIKALMRILLGQCTRLDHNLTIYDETKFSSCHTPYINSILHAASSYFFWVTRSSFRQVISMSMRDQICSISVHEGYTKTHTRNITYGRWKQLKLCAHHQGDFFMKCNTFYEDQCCASYFKSEGTKITECPSY